jgi:hypothetical protein
VDSALEVKPIQAEHKKVNKEQNVETENDYNFVPLAQKEVTVKSEVQPQVIVKEVSNIHEPKINGINGYNDYFTSFIFRLPAVQEIMWWQPNYRSSYRKPQVCQWTLFNIKRTTKVATRQPGIIVSSTHYFYVLILYALWITPLKK